MLDRFFPRKESLSNQDSPEKRKFTDDLTQFETPKKNRVGKKKIMTLTHLLLTVVKPMIPHK